VEDQSSGRYQNIPKATMAVEYPWKLVVTHWRRQVELYNLEKDPMEGINLAGKEVKRARGLHRHIAGWRDQAGPEAPAPDAANLRRLEALGYVQ